MKKDAQTVGPYITPVVRLILDYVRAHSCGLDERLPSERQFAHLLDISRNSLREAMKTLQALGVIEIKRGSGIYLRKKDFNPHDHASLWLLIHRTEILDILTVRETLDMRAIDLVPLEKYLDVAAQLRDCLDHIDPTPSGVDALRQHDLAFHTIVRLAAGNKVLYDICNSLNGSIYDERRALFSIPGQMRRCVADHRRIMECYFSGSRDAVYQAMSDHLFGVRQAIENAMPR
ncbi:MAG: FCD domain-containing protein [Planctomycetaceae bacterium]|nr:FCD domain-containing protein [Planctomycetaceae bacterium]